MININIIIDFNCLSRPTVIAITWLACYVWHVILVISYYLVYHTELQKMKQNIVMACCCHLCWRDVKHQRTLIDSPLHVLIFFGAPHPQSPLRIALHSHLSFPIILKRSPFHWLLAMRESLGSASASVRADRGLSQLFSSAYLLVYPMYRRLHAYATKTVH